MVRYRERNVYTLTMPCRSHTIGNVMTKRSRSDMLGGMATEPRETDFLWPDPAAGPWWVKIWWRSQRGVPTPVGISLRSWVTREESRATGPHNALPAPKDEVLFPAITGKLLRSLPLGQFIEATHSQYEQLLDLPSWREWPDAAADRAAMADGRRTGTRDLGDAHYGEVARIYREAVKRRESPTKAVAEAFTISKSTAAKQVARARERGLLPPTSRGIVGPVEETL